MKSSKLILALCLGASAWAQTLPQKQQANPYATVKPTGAQIVSPTALSAKSPVVPVTTRAAMPSAVPQNAKVKRVNDPAKHVTDSAKPAAAQLSKPIATSSVRFTGKRTTRQPVRSVERKYVRRKIVGSPSSSAENALAVNRMPGPTARTGRRDPFVSPVVERIRNAVTCTGSGKQCLVVGELSLHGVVRSPNGFIAVVMNGEHTYFLREHDPLADGAVERITKDTIVLRERSSDVLGRRVTREVTKKLGVPSV